MTSKLEMFGSAHGNFNCRWTIERFSSVDSQVGRHRQSNPFQLESIGIQWYLMLFAGGETEESKGYVSVFVCKHDEAQKVNLKFNIALCNTKGENLFTSEHKWTGFTNGRNGCRNAMEAKVLKSKLVDDVLVVNVEVTYCVTCVGNGVVVHRSPDLAPMVKIIEDFTKLWVTKENTNCTITVGGEDINVHSLVLAARSEVFAAMFKHDTLEKDTRRVKITDFEKDIMDSFMEFIYSGCVCDMNYDLALELLRASDKYEVSDLKSYCSNYLMCVMDDGNVCQVLVSADIYNARELRCEAMKYLCESQTVVFFEAQRSIFKTRPELLCDIVEEMIRKKKT